MHLENSLKTLPLSENPHLKLISQPEHVNNAFWLDKKGRTLHDSLLLWETNLLIVT